MAEQIEKGTGISWKLRDGTMVWVKREDWAEVVQDIRVIKGEDYLKTLEAELKGGAVAPVQTQAASSTVAVEPASPSSTEMTPEQVAQELGGGQVQQAFELCEVPGCGNLKNKLIKAGVSKRTGKAYPAFYVCPVNHGR